MKSHRKPASNMRKYYQLVLVIVCFISIITLLIYRHEYYRLRYVLEVLNFFGKPGLSEIEFCGPGFNATMLSDILRNMSMEIRETPPFFQQLDENFYSYSSFLRSYQKYDKLTPTYAHNIDTIVIGKANIQPKFRCNIWLENSNQPKPGRFSYKTVRESSGDYRLYIFQCSLNKNLGKPKGVSFYVNDHNINPIHSPINRLIEVNTKRKLRVTQNVKFVNVVEPAVCLIPNQIPFVSKDSLIESLVFHQMMGINYFTIYDSMISEDIIKRLNLLPFDITQWRVQFFPLNFPFIFAKSYDIVRQAVEYDCLFRHFRLDKEDIDKASHLIVMSWDEFLVPRVHSNLKAVVDDLDPTRRLISLEIKSLLFCLNQDDDKDAEISVPDIMKKTHYYKTPQKSKSVYIRNLDAMKTFDNIFNLTTNKIAAIEVLGMHKYSQCRDPKSYHPVGIAYNESQMDVFQHKFEGSMIRFSQNLMDNKVYRLYKSGKIWEKVSDEVDRDL